MRRFFFTWTANLIFVAHLCLGVFFILGWLVPEWAIVYWVLMSGWLGSWLVLGFCPLSRAEFWLRHQCRPQVDPFREIIQFYVHKFTGVCIASHSIIVGGVVVYVVLMLLSAWQYFE